MSAERHAELVVNGLSAGYTRELIVRDVFLEVAMGEISALVGPNGCGKSTLLKAISGVIPSASGTVTVGCASPRDVTRMSPQQRAACGLIYVPQLDNVFPSLTVSENLKVGLDRAVWKSLRTKEEEIFQLFPDLYTSRARRARQLSGGQREMLAIAIALIRSPNVVLIDEPSAGLSPKVREIIWDQLVKLRSSGVALLVVEQDVGGIMQIADIAHLMVEGSIVMSGPGKDLLANEEMASRYLGVDESILEARGAGDGPHTSYL